MRKKGFMAMEQIAKMILAIAAFFIIAVLIYKLFSGLQAESVEQACRTSVTLKMNLRDQDLKGKLASAIFPIQCETQEVKVPKKISRSMTPEDIRNETMKDIAEMMASCWWMFGNGKYYKVFKDIGYNSNKCHVCYSFTIPIGTEGFEKPIDKKTFLEFLETHHYDPGLLRGGNALTGANNIYEYTPQQVTESSRDSRKITENRLLASKKRLENGIADFTGILENLENKDVNELYVNTLQIQQKGLEIVVVMVPSMPEGTFDDDADIALQLLDEWQIGTETDNGIVLLFSFNDGILHYANGVGAHAVISEQFFKETVLNQTFFDLMKTNETAEAVMYVITNMLGSLNDKDVEGIVNYQRTYMGYIGGGVIGSLSDDYRARFLNANGAITFPPEDEKNPFVLTPGERYAIAYVSPKWNTIHSFFWPFDAINVNSASIPNQILITVQQDLNSYGKAPCNVIQED